MLAALSVVLFVLFMAAAFGPWLYAKANPTPLPVRIWHVERKNSLWYVTNLLTGSIYYRAPLNRWFLKGVYEDTEVNPKSGLVRRLEQAVTEALNE